MQPKEIKIIYKDIETQEIIIMLFYSDNIYLETLKRYKAEIPPAYNKSFDEHFSKMRSFQHCNFYVDDEYICSGNLGYSENILIISICENEVSIPSNYKEYFLDFRKV